MLTEPLNQDVELAEFFTDMEFLQKTFKEYISSPKLPKHLFIIHGVGGAGKSSVLRMFRLHCKRSGLPVALASGDESKSVLDVLIRWAAGLQANNITMPKFSKTFSTYRLTQTKVDEHAHKSVDNKLVDFASRTASNTAEAAMGTALGAALGSIVPGIGTFAGGAIGGAIGNMGGEVLFDWMRSFLKQPDIDLLLDPSQGLTNDFLDDLAIIANKQRLVLILDTFEQMAGLEEWTGKLAQRLHENVLLVIAGRAVPEWDRQWSGWMANAKVEELQPMTEAVMRDLVRNFYTYIRGGEPEPKQVEAIVRFARGLPLAVTTAVQLWVKYDVTDFEDVKSQVVANLVKRLREGVSKSVLPMLDAAAVVRYFNEPILRAVSKQEDASEAFAELCNFPFARPRMGGFMLHDVVREMLDENLRLQDPERHSELHQRAADYYAARIKKASLEEAERLGLERLYHLIAADEFAGIQMFQEMADELINYRLLSRLRSLLNDAETYRLEYENNRLWRDYYSARLEFVNENLQHAELVFQKVCENQQAESKLRAYSYSNWAAIRVKTRFLMQEGGIQRVIELVNQSNSLLPTSDPRRLTNILSLGDAYIRTSDIDKATVHLQQALEFYTTNKDNVAASNICSLLAEMYARIGDWQKMFEMKQLALLYSPHQPGSPAYLHLKTRWAVAWAWAGRLAEAESVCLEDLKSRRELGQSSVFMVLRDLVVISGFQSKDNEAATYFSEAVTNHRQIHSTWSVHGQPEDGHLLGFYATVLIRQGDINQAQKHFERSLEVKLKIRDFPGLPEVLTGLAKVEEIRNQLNLAAGHYSESLKYRWLQRHYFECGALTGLIRVYNVQEAYTTLASIFAEAENLAQEYEYNDYLASLRLTQAQAVWDEKMSEWGSGFESALHYYCRSLIYALRYNRFLLDEVLWGGNVSTPLHPVISQCLQRGREGYQMLMELRDWWRTGTNDVGTSLPDTISPIPEGISLLEAERIARQREPGNGSTQFTVLEKLDEAIRQIEIH